MLTLLEKARLAYQPRFPKALINPLLQEEGESKASQEIKSLFPLTSSNRKLSFKEGIDHPSGKVLRVGVLFSGGQAPGGHNVVTGLLDSLLSFNPDSQLIGFLDGPSGLIQGKAILLNAEILAPFRNQGGFHLLGSGRTKIETGEQFEKVRKVVEEMNLDGLVIIGGDDSNTNAAYLAEDFVKHQIECTVVGVPKTIDGDLKSNEVEISFGFDTASKLYSELIGNLGTDILSAKKMWAFVKLMGRSASHLTLECALATEPNLTLIGEAIEKEQKTLRQITEEITDLIVERAKAGKPYGIILVPEGMIEFISEFKRLVHKLNQAEELDQEGKHLYELLPKSFLADRDPHGNIQVSKIETEKLLINLVQKELEKRKEKVSFNPQPFFFGYEGRAGLPTNFDANYCYSLGRVAALGVVHLAQGRMAALSHLELPPEQWVASLVPIVSMMGFENRKGKRVGVISKALVDLKGSVYKEFLERSTKWRLKDSYLSPGPIQFFGPEELTDTIPLMLKMR